MEENLLILRISQPDAEELTRKTFVEKSIKIGADQSEFFKLVFEIMRTDKIKAFMDYGILYVIVPADAYSAWIKNEEPYLEAIQSAGNSEELKIIIEKDFKLITENEGSKGFLGKVALKMVTKQNNFASLTFHFQYAKNLEVL
ncbi:MAG: hypothetical protein EA409_06325 [Saprospirales bacterium]|nr:MAG: hypothetical protein EA409_06325 [Saprospirales bacterium]